VITTDAYVVSPLFFPGGDIGSLAVTGTVNDLVVRGAEPLHLTLSLILEEGLPLETLKRVLASAGEAARRYAVSIVAGDTKVVPRGAADGMFISTTGLGRLLEPAPPGAASLSPGDALLVTGPVGCHGIAVLCAREELGFDPLPTSDCGPLSDAAEALRSARIVPRAMRDATRGGVTAVLHEWAQDCGLTLSIEEKSVPATDAARGVCELLGLDPLSVACEGTMVVAVSPADAQAALLALRSVRPHSAIIGEIHARRGPPVAIRRLLGHEQVLAEPSGAPLPRIC
jgi:hydrogenase expression/formation protein HypE